MDIEYTDVETGKKERHEASNLTQEVLDAIANLDFSEEQTKRIIDQLNVSADAKSAIFSIMKLTIKVGNVLVKIGRKILDIIIGFFKEHPNVGFGAIFGAFIGLLLSMIPIIGQIMGPLVIPVFTAYGMVQGAKEDLKDKDIDRKLRIHAAQFQQFA